MVLPFFATLIILEKLVFQSLSFETGTNMTSLKESRRNASQGHFNIALDEMEFTTSILSENDRIFLDAVRRDDMTAVKELIDGGLVDVNCMDDNGLTPVQIAVKEGNLNILSFLLDRKADIFIGNALLDAINKESLECVMVLVDYDKHQREAGTLPVKTERKMSAIKEMEHYTSFITPLTLAAQLGNYEITKFLMTQGYTIEDPHQKFCDCEECSKLGRLGCYLSHLNTYRALVSPVYISLTFLLAEQHQRTKNNDPFYRALVLKKQLLEHADMEYEFREDYLKLAKECEDFAASLLDQCRDLQEISSTMAMPGMKGVTGVEVRGGSSRQKKLSVLNFAIKYRSKKFIAHRYSQVMLNTELFFGLRGLLEENNDFIAGFLVVLYWTVMPIFMTLYQFIPSSPFTTLFEVPIMKCLSHMGSSIWFLVLLIMAAFQDKLPNSKALEISPIDVLIGLWVFGILVEEVKQARRQGKERYISQWWHLITLVIITFFLLTGALWISGYAMLAEKEDSLSLSVRFLFKQTNVTPRTLLLLSNSFYAVSLVLTFFQVSHYFQVSYLLGPLHMSMMRMVGDLIKFFVLFSLNYVSFAIGIRKLYSQYHQTATGGVGSVAGMNQTGEAKTEFSSIGSSFRHLFWGLFGLTDPSVFKTTEGFEITEATGELMFAVYVMSALLVAFNVLIAMLTNTFKKVAEDQDISFKVARTQILMQYVNQGSVAPPPFNLFPFKAACAFIYNMCAKDDLQLPDLASLDYNERKRNRIIKLLIQRYFFEHNKKVQEILKARDLDKSVQSESPPLTNQTNAF